MRYDRFTIASVFLSFAPFALGLPDIEVNVTEEPVIFDTEILCGVSPKASEDIVIRNNYTLVHQVLAEPGQLIKAGEIIAESSAQKLELEIAELATKIRQDENQLALKKLEYKKQEDELKRQRILAERNIVAKNQIEVLDLQLSQSNVQVLTQENALSKQYQKQRELLSQQGQGRYASKIDGILTFLLISSKQLSGVFQSFPGETFGRIQSDHDFDIRCQFFPYQNSKFAIKQNLEVQFPRYGNAWEAQGTCAVTAIGPLLDKNNKKVKGVFQLSCDYTSSIYIRKDFMVKVVSKDKEVMPVKSLPWNAIYTNEMGAYVRVKDPSSGEIAKTVTLGKRGSYRVEIKEGLNVGDRVLAQAW